MTYPTAAGSPDGGALIDGDVDAFVEVRPASLPPVLGAQPASAHGHEQGALARPPEAAGGVLVGARGHLQRLGLVHQPRRLRASGVHPEQVHRRRGELRLLPVPPGVDRRGPRAEGDHLADGEGVVPLVHPVPRPELAHVDVVRARDTVQGVTCRTHARTHAAAAPPAISAGGARTSRARPAPRRTLSACHRARPPPAQSQLRRAQLRGR
eukprot:scaffold2032_cov392-Prasinococcus_capsulatus_cf.AAC.3